VASISRQPSCVAVEKGEAQAITDIDPLPYLWLKDGKLNEVATNLSGEFADRICCVLAIRGSLIRDELPVATALTRSVLEAGDRVARDPVDAAAALSGYGGRGVSRGDCCDAAQPYPQ
jgi:NitT/TauT family transport system substrate-binding protein